MFWDRFIKGRLHINPHGFDRVFLGSFFFWRQACENVLCSSRMLWARNVSSDGWTMGGCRHAGRPGPLYESKAQLMQTNAKVCKWCMLFTPVVGGNNTVHAAITWPMTKKQVQSGYLIWSAGGVFWVQKRIAFALNTNPLSDSSPEWRGIRDGAQNQYTQTTSCESITFAK